MLHSHGMQRRWLGRHKWCLVDRRYSACDVSHGRRIGCIEQEQVLHGRQTRHTSNNILGRYHSMREKCVKSAWMRATLRTWHGTHGSFYSKCRDESHMCTTTPVDPQKVCAMMCNR